MDKEWALRRLLQAVGNEVRRLVYRAIKRFGVYFLFLFKNSGKKSGFGTVASHSASFR